MGGGRRALAALLLGGLAAASGCSEGGGSASGGPAGPGDAEKGRAVYLANCAACHSTDPSRDGTLGPAIAGSSRELVEARVVHGTYPPGYTPKRPSAVMLKLPHLAPAVPDLAAYLQSVTPAAGG
jgi:mono/diheme cytochrome c family protein